MQSETIGALAAALSKAQADITGALKDSSNPFFKSKYADLNSIREAALPVLNSHGITVIQPTTIIDGVDYVETTPRNNYGDVEED